MSWTILEQPEEMRLDGKPIWVYAKHSNGKVCYRMNKFGAENSISGVDGTPFGEVVE